MILRCNRKTNGIEPKCNSEVSGVGFTNKITRKALDSNYTDKAKYASQERERR
jgi:hypothetical protein